MGVAAFRFVCDGLLGLGWGDAEIEDEVLTRQAVNAVFEMLDPATKVGALVRRGARGLVREIGADVAVDESDFALVEGGFDFGLGLEAVASVKERGEMGVDGFERAELAVEKLAYHFAEPGIVLREARRVDVIAAGV